MLRYHTSTNKVDLSDADIRSRFCDTISTGLVIPILNRHTSKHVHTSEIAHEHGVTTATRKLETTDDFTLIAMTRKQGESDFQVNLGGAHPNLPVIMLPDPALSAAQQSCIVDGIKSGVCHATTGAGLGAGIGLLWGGPSGAVAGAYWGASVVGGVSFAGQLVLTYNTNTFRQFAARANGFLIEARDVGLSQEVRQAFWFLCSRAVMPAEKDLVRQIVMALEAEFGVNTVAPLRARYAKI